MNMEDQRRQNLLIFNRENKKEQKNYNNMVRPYMNRFIIDEDDQHEILGIKNLDQKRRLFERKRVSGKAFFFRTHNNPFHLKEHLKQYLNEQKILKKKAFFRKAHSTPIVHQNANSDHKCYDTHFLIESRSKRDCEKMNLKFRKWISCLQDSANQKINSLSSRSFIIFTQLVRYKSKFISKKTKPKISLITDDSELALCYYKISHQNRYFLTNRIKTDLDVTKIAFCEYRPSVAFKSKRILLSSCRVIILPARDRLRTGIIEKRSLVIFRHPISEKISVDQESDPAYQYLYCECARYTLVI